MTRAVVEGTHHVYKFFGASPVSAVGCIRFRLGLRAGGGSAARRWREAICPCTARRGGPLAGGRNEGGGSIAREGSGNRRRGAEKGWDEPRCRRAGHPLSR